MDSLKPRIRPRSLNESFTLAYSRVKPLKRVSCNALIIRLSEDFLVVSRGEVSQRGTRQDNQLHFPKVRLEIVKRLPSNGPKLYNGLPNFITMQEGQNP